MCKGIFILYVNVYVHTFYTCVHLHMHLHICVYMHTCRHACMYIHNTHMSTQVTFLTRASRAPSGGARGRGGSAAEPGPAAIRDEYRVILVRIILLTYDTNSSFTGNTNSSK